MDVIIQMGSRGIFLVVADFIMWAKKQGIAVGLGRWLGGRFDRRVRHGHHRPRPDPARSDLRAGPEPRACLHADVDIDFDERRRVEVIRYVTEKYGADKVAMIGTYGRSRRRTPSRTARPGLPVRHGRPPHQGDARRRFSARASTSAASPTPPALQRGLRDPRDVRDEPDVKRGHRHRQGRRGPGPADGRARRRCDHVQRAHRRPRPGRRHTDGVTITQWDYPQAASRSAC